MIILIVIGYLALTIIALITVLLLTPIIYNAEGIRNPDVPLNIKASLNFGIISFRYCAGTDCGIIKKLRILGMPVNIKQRHNKASDNVSRKKKQKKKSSRWILNKELISQLIKTAKELFRHIKFRKCEISGVFGFDDPYVTAIVWIIICGIPLNGNNTSISLNPVFDDEIVEGSFNIQGRIVPAVIAYIALKFILSKAYINNKKIKGE